MKKLHVCIVTGTRAEFGIWRPVIAGIRKSPRLKLSLVATGMHLQKQFGHTIKDIEGSGIPIAAKVPMYKPNEPPAKSLARGIEGLAAAYRTLQPDLVFLLGDRLEMLAAANAALAERLPIAHLHGGETAPGIWDEQIRHAITKMAHLHFCATKSAAARIRQMGEDPTRIHVVGAPALDLAIQVVEGIRAFLKKPKFAEVDQRISDLIRESLPLLLLHPSSPDEQAEYNNARLLVNALVRRFPGKRIPTIGPNNDPGYQGILRAYAEAGDQLHLTMSVPQMGFWTQLAYCRFLIGNSSSGIIEAASFGIPAINVGPRQSGRERNLNVIDVPWSAGAAGIRRAIDRALSDRAFIRRVSRRRNLYGDGHAAARIVEVFTQWASRSLCALSLTKQFVS